MTKDFRRCMFTIIDVGPCARARAAQVTGWIYGFYFEALTSCRHARTPSWEIGGSRITRLQLECPERERIVYLWDCGTVIPATEYGCELSVEFLTTHLADLVYTQDFRTATPRRFIKSVLRRFSAFVSP